ncbi:MAG TPA: hypothetical protein VF855_10870 [Acidimicrobiales bacterium]
MAARTRKNVPWSVGVGVAAVAGALFVVGALGYQWVQASTAEDRSATPDSSTTVLPGAEGTVAPVSGAPAVGGVAFTGSGAVANSPKPPGASPSTSAAALGPAPGQPTPTTPAPSPEPTAAPTTTAPPPPTTAAPPPPPGSPAALIAAIPIPSGYSDRQVSDSAVTYTYPRGRSCGHLVEATYASALSVGWTTESYVSGAPSAILSRPDPPLRIAIICAPGDRSQVLEIGLV